MKLRKCAAFAEGVSDYSWLQVDHKLKYMTDMHLTKLYLVLDRETYESSKHGIIFKTLYTLFFLCSNLRLLVLSTH